MQLAELVRQETGVPPQNIMLLRHSTENINELLAHGATVEDYTELQPTGSKYDFLAHGRPQADVVVVIVHDRVYGVYRVLGIEAEGTTFTLASEGHRRFDIARERIERPARKFCLTRLPSSADGALITGWEGKEIAPVLRSHTDMFGAIEANAVVAVRLPEEVPAGITYREGSVERVTVNKYERDPRTKPACVAYYGLACVVCGFDFGAVYGAVASGYIHVHHLKPLSEIGGEYEVDPIRDLRPVCPNCHAVIHMDGQSRSIEEVKAVLEQARKIKVNPASIPGV